MEDDKRDLIDLRYFIIEITISAILLLGNICGAIFVYENYKITSREGDIAQMEMRLLSNNSAPVFTLNRFETSNIMINQGMNIDCEISNISEYATIDVTHFSAYEYVVISDMSNLVPLSREIWIPIIRHKPKLEYTISGQIIRYSECQDYVSDSELKQAVSAIINGVKTQDEITTDNIKYACSLVYVYDIGYTDKLGRTIQSQMTPIRGILEEIKVPDITHSYIFSFKESDSYNQIMVDYLPQVINSAINDSSAFTEIPYIEAYTALSMKNAF